METLTKMAFRGCGQMEADDMSVNSRAKSRDRVSLILNYGLVGITEANQLEVIAQAVVPIFGWEGHISGYYAARAEAA